MTDTTPRISAHWWHCKYCGGHIPPDTPHQYPVHGVTAMALLWEVRGMLLGLDAKIDELRVQDKPTAEDREAVLKRCWRTYKRIAERWFR